MNPLRRPSWDRPPLTRAALPLAALTLSLLARGGVMSVGDSAFRLHVPTAAESSVAEAIVRIRGALMREHSLAASSFRAN
jgi:hypothetical protein